MATLERRVQVVLHTPGTTPRVIFDSSPGGGGPPSVLGSGIAFQHDAFQADDGLRPASDGTIVWVGDAENNTPGSRDYSQWQTTANVQAVRVPGTVYTISQVGDGDIQVVTSPTRNAGSIYAWKHIIYQTFALDGTIRGDLGLVKANMGGVGGTLDGQEQYWGWSFYIPSTNDDSSSNTTWANWSNWNTIADMHPDAVGAALNNIYPLSFGIRPSTQKIYFDSAMTGHVPNPFNDTVIAPLQYDSWYDVIFYIKWSTTANGHVTVWVRYSGSGGYQQVFDASFQTMDVGDDPYWKQALYTGDDGAGRAYTNTIIHDQACRGTSFAAVAAKIG